VLDDDLYVSASEGMRTEKNATHNRLFCTGNLKVEFEAVGEARAGAVVGNGEATAKWWLAEERSGVTKSPCCGIYTAR
jgi:hypothetical protein